MTMAEVSFLTVRSEVMSLKRFYLRIYNYSVQIKFLSKNPNYLTVINEYEKIFVNLCYFSFMRKRIWRKLEKIGDIPPFCTLKEILFLLKNDHFIIVTNKHSALITHIHFSCSAHKNTFQM